jgi:hypothetical protein
MPPDAGGRADKSSRRGFRRRGHEITVCWRTPPWAAIAPNSIRATTIRRSVSAPTTTCNRPAQRLHRAFRRSAGGRCGQIGGKEGLGGLDRQRVQFLRCTPRRLILGKPSGWIMHFDLVGQFRPPTPQHEICHIGPRPRRERWRQDASRPSCDKHLGNFPGRGGSSVCKIIRPRTSHSDQIDHLGSTSGFSSQIDDIVNVDVVSADRQRIKAVGEAVPHFNEHTLDCQSQIKRWRADRIETPPFRRCTVARSRCPRPSGIVRSVARPLPSQAKPPVATWSR